MVTSGHKRQRLGELRHIAFERGALEIKRYTPATGRLTKVGHRHPPPGSTPRSHCQDARISVTAVAANDPLREYANAERGGIHVGENVSIHLTPREREVWGMAVS